MDIDNYYSAHIDDDVQLKNGKYFGDIIDRMLENGSLEEVFSRMVGQSPGKDDSTTYFLRESYNQVVAELASEMFDPEDFETNYDINDDLPF